MMPYLLFEMFLFLLNNISWTSFHISRKNTVLGDHFTSFLNREDFIYLYSFWSFCLFRAAPAAQRDSQARGQIRAIAAGLHHTHSNAGSELCLQTTQLMAMPNP